MLLHTEILNVSLKVVLKKNPKLLMIYHFEWFWNYKLIMNCEINCEILKNKIRKTVVILTQSY